MNGSVSRDQVKFFTRSPPTTIVFPSGTVTVLSTEFFTLGGGNPFLPVPVKLLSSTLYDNCK